MELRDLRVAILDQDHSDHSRDLVRAHDRERLHRRGRAPRQPRRDRAGLPAGQVPRRAGHPAGCADLARRAVQVLVDGSDAATAATVDNYLQAVVGAGRAAAAARPPARRRRRSPRARASGSTPSWRAPTSWCPGLVALVLMMICALLTSIAITREKETGTLEQILTTPVHAGAGDRRQGAALRGARRARRGADPAHRPPGLRRADERLLAGRWPAYCLLFIVIALGVGLLISARVTSQRVAMMAALMVTMLPTMILSGFMFPIASMPRAAAGASASSCRPPIS